MTSSPRTPVLLAADGHLAAAVEVDVPLQPGIPVQQRDKPDRRLHHTSEVDVVEQGGGGRAVTMAI